MNFVQGANHTSDIRQQIAFWIYIIDSHAHIIRSASFLFPYISTSDICITNSVQSYLGAVRSGFEHSIQHLPDPVRTPVQIHLYKVTESLGTTYVHPDIVQCDVLFGHSDPFNFYYSGVRLEHNLPLVPSEFCSY